MPDRALSSKLGLPQHCEPMLRQALTHPAAVDGDITRSYQRLEFLGDAVLGMIVAEELYRRHPDSPEGELTRARATVVSRTTLAEEGDRMGLEALLITGVADPTGASSARRKKLADALEAVIGATYLTCGLDAARDFVLRVLGHRINAAMSISHAADVKSRLQEYCQAQYRAVPQYTVLASSGPDHAPNWVVAVALGSHRLGVGEGRTKRMAEQQAASCALELLTQRAAHSEPTD